MGGTSYVTFAPVATDYGVLSTKKFPVPPKGAKVNALSTTLTEDKKGLEVLLL